MKAAIVKTNFVSDVNERLHYTSVYLTTLHSGRQQTSIRGGTVLCAGILPGSCSAVAVLGASTQLGWEPHLLTTLYKTNAVGKVAC